jgi:predicted GNAT family N-acyltransferase
MTLKICSADTKNAYWPVIKAIRYEVFVVEQKVDEREEYDGFEETSHHFLALADGRAAGTARWRATEKGYKLERFAVLENFRGVGVGAGLLKTILEEVLPLAKSQKKDIYLHAQVQAMPFYARSGFVPFGDEFVEAEILHRAMKYKD